jgi:hypothetical protein
MIKAKVDDLITCIRWKNILIWQADCEPVAEFSLKPGVSERLWSKKWVCVGSWIGQRKSPVIVLWCFLMFFFVFCLSASFVWYRKGDVCRGGITVLNSRSCKTQGCHFLQSSLFIYAFLVVWLGLNQILSILLLFFSHPILERWNRNFSSNLFQPQWGTMSGGVAWLQRGRDEHMAGFWSMHLSWFIIRSSSPKVKPHWGPSVCVFVPCERVEDGGRAHVGYGVNDFVVTFSIFFGSCKKTRSTFQDCKLSFLLTLPPK